MRAVLSRDLLASIRHHLSAALPDIGTSRLAECLAAGLGYQTNAALLAAIDAHPVGEVLQRRIDPVRFHERLSRFGLPGAPSSDDVPEIVMRALVLSNAMLANDRFDHLEDPTSWDPGSAPHQRLAHLSFLFRWRVRQASILNLVVDFLDPIGRECVPMLCNLWSSRRDIDRDVADMLVDWLNDARLVADGVAERPDWASRIYHGHFPRILRFMESAVATWRDVDGMPPSTPVAIGRRPQKPMRLVPGVLNAPGETGIDSGGLADEEALSGVAAMAAYRAGWTKEAIARLVGEMVMGRDAALLALTRAFPASPDLDRVVTERMMSDSHRSLLRARVVAVRDDASLEQARIMLSVGGILRDVPTPPAQGAGPDALTDWRRLLHSALRVGDAVLEIDFADRTPHQDAVDALVEVLTLSGAQILAVRSTKELDQLLREVGAPSTADALRVP